MCVTVAQQPKMYYYPHDEAHHRYPCVTKLCLCVSNCMRETNSSRKLHQDKSKSDGREELLMVFGGKLNKLSQMVQKVMEEYFQSVTS